jgi:hypothetical protein
VAASLRISQSIPAASNTLRANPTWVLSNEVYNRFIKDLIAIDHCFFISRRRMQTNTPPHAPLGAPAITPTKMAVARLWLAKANKTTRNPMNAERATIGISRFSIFIALRLIALARPFVNISDPEKRADSQKATKRRGKRITFSSLYSVQNLQANRGR